MQFVTSSPTFEMIINIPAFYNEIFITYNIIFNGDYITFLTHLVCSNDTEFTQKFCWMKTVQVNAACVVFFKPLPSAVCI